MPAFRLLFSFIWSNIVIKLLSSQVVRVLFKFAVALFYMGERDVNESVDTRVKSCLTISGDF